MRWVLALAGEADQAAGEEGQGAAACEQMKRMSGHLKAVPASPKIRVDNRAGGVGAIFDGARGIPLKQALQQSGVVGCI